jgi:hypothetical protein
MKINVRLIPNHPTGSRRRAGFVFGAGWQEYDVTEDQLQEIREDNYLIIKEEKKTAPVKKEEPAKKDVK